MSLPVSVMSVIFESKTPPPPIIIMKKAKSSQSTLHKYFGGTGPLSSDLPQKKRRCGLSGLTLYTEEEISESKGMDKSFKQFWNRKVEEISTDKSCKKRLQSRSSMQGAIYTAWTLQKTEYLVIEADEIKKISKDLAHLKSLKKMNTCHYDVIAEYNYLEELHKEGASRDLIAIAEKKIEEKMSDLKKAQLALTKAIARRRETAHHEEIKRAQDQSSTTSLSLSENDTQSLPTEVMEKLVDDIKCETTAFYEGDYHCDPDHEATKKVVDYSDSEEEN